METCSEQTPNGLYFGGARLGDDFLVGVRGPRATAAGGTQTIRVYRDSAADRPFTQSFRASTTSSDLVVTGFIPPIIEVEAKREGGTYLRVSEPQTDALFDRLWIDAKGVEQVGLLPFPWTLGDYGIDEHTQFALWRGSETELVVTLHSRSGRVVDESMAIRAPGSWWATTTGWDTLKATPTSYGDATLDIELGDGQVFSIPVRSVDYVDDLYWTSGWGSDDDPSVPLDLDEYRLFCFRAVAGGEPIIGAPFEFAADGAVALDGSADRNCVGVRAVDLGEGSLTVTVDDVSVSWPLTVTSYRRVPRDAAPPRFQPSLPLTPGERAAR